jgi:hypothetical protein
MSAYRPDLMSAPWRSLSHAERVERCRAAAGWNRYCRRNHETAEERERWSSWPRCQHDDYVGVCLLCSTPGQSYAKQ